MNPFDPAILLPGDMMLYYDEHNPVDWVIAEKTGKRVSHVERFIGDGQSIASRNGIGVGTYPLRLDGLVCVRRINVPWKLADGLAWFKTVDGQAYDFKGLLTATAFVGEGTPGDMFCSEFSLNFDRACGVEPFNPSLRADCCYPRDLWMCPAFTTVWKASDDY